MAPLTAFRIHRAVGLLLLLTAASSAVAQKTEFGRRERIALAHTLTSDQAISFVVGSETTPTRLASSACDGKSLAWAVYEDKVNETGWAEFHGGLCAGGDSSAVDKTRALGYLEGFLTAERIQQAYDNYCAASNFVNGSLPLKVQSFIDVQNAWLWSEVARSPSDPYWANVAVSLWQIKGMHEGFLHAANGDPSLRKLEFSQFYLLCNMGDLEDLIPAFARSSSKEPTLPFGRGKIPSLGERGECSGLVKLGRHEIFFGHTTFNAYWCMLRIFKTYDFGSEITGCNGRIVSFSSRPGDLESKDDYYIISSGLGVLETSLSVLNTTLYERLRPQTVPAWLRGVVANRLARSPAEWASVFALHNSGTHNNQWLAVDMHAHVRDEQIPDNTIWLLEQFPGRIVDADITDVVRRQKYFPSYNLPYFAQVWKAMGYDAFAYNYLTYPRAEIFHAKQHTVQSLSEMQRLMNSNHFQTDPLSRGNPCNAISARCDLAGKKAFGGIDSKVTSSLWARELAIHAISGPSHQTQAVFSFAPHFSSTPHAGIPETMDFDWVVMRP